MALILASTSPARQAILQKLNIPFSCQAPNVDETPLENETAQELVRRLAIAKAQAVKAGPGDFVIGADQVASHNDAIIGKPLTREKAQKQLNSFSGNAVNFYTGLALVHGGDLRSTVETCTVKFRNLAPQEIERYLNLEDSLNCAGAIKSEGLAIHLFTGIFGRDPHALVGLPVIALGELLREFGVNLLDLTAV